MIDRVVQRPFLLWQAEAAANAAAGEPARALPEGDAPSAEEVEAAQAAIREAVAAERRVPPTPPESDGMRAADAQPIERLSYFPRDPVLSLVQSAVERYLMSHAPAGLVVPTLPSGQQLRGEGGSAVADFSLRIDDDSIPPEEPTADRLGGANEYTDPRWLSSVVAMGWRLLKGRQPFPERPAEPRQLGTDARVVVVGDWASGNLRAQRVGKQMRAAVEAARAERREVHVIHLGDTYYAGWDYEYRDKFLPHWPVKTEEAAEIGSWSLPGNHDVYTGGHGYYQVLLEDDRFRPYHGGSSRFSLENEHWQLLGLDTAWADHDLAGDQGQWVERKLAADPDRRTMLLSHHQPFSSYGGDGPKLKQALAGPLAAGEIDSWLWGHEHRCVVYEPGQIAAARCIGHGGVPAYAPRPKPDDVIWHLDRSFKDGLESWAYCGFAVLDFDGPAIAVEYVNEFGETDFEEAI